MFIFLLTVVTAYQAGFWSTIFIKSILYFNDFKCMDTINKHYSVPQNYLEKFKTSSYNNL